MAVRTLRWWFLALSALLLAGCGFHLRGAFQLPPVMARTALSGVNPNGPLGSELVATLTGAGAQVVPVLAKPAPTAVLQITDQSYDRNVASVDSQGRASEYELAFHLGFTLTDAAGKTLVPPSRVTVTRSYPYDANNVLGMQDLEDRMRADLRGDAVRQMMRRIWARTRPGAVPAKAAAGQ